MSTNTRMSFTPPPEFRVKTEFKLGGRQTMNLERLLGQGGQEIVRNALVNLTHRSAPLPGEEHGILDWECVEEGRHYRLKIPQQALSALHGVESLTVHLEMRGPLTAVSHEAHFSRTRMSTEPAASVEVSAQQHEEVRQLVNRSVNQVLAYSVSQRLENHLRQEVKQKLNIQNEQRLKQIVNTRITNRINIQTLARVRH